MDNATTGRAWRWRVAFPFVAAVFLTLSACAPGTGVFDVRLRIDVTPVVRAGVQVVRVPPERPAGGITVRPRADQAFRIPPGHYPPPGQCRVWIPGRPPGQQPPPGACSRLEREVPRGAYLIEG